jgi:hypothetical protein
MTLTVLRQPVLVCFGHLPPREALLRWRSLPKATFISELIELIVFLGGVLDCLRGLLFPLFCRRHGAPSAAYLINSFTKHSAPNFNSSDVADVPELRFLALIGRIIIRVLEGRLLPTQAVELLAAVSHDLYVRTLIFLTLQLATVLDGLQAVGLLLPPRPSRDLIAFEFERATHVELANNPTPGTAPNNQTRRGRKRQKTEIDLLYEEEMNRGGSE